MANQMNNPAITRSYAMVLTIMDNAGGINKIYVPQPSKNAVLNNARVLQRMYKEATDGTPPDVLVVDYMLIVKDACEGDEARMTQVTAFLDRTLLGAKVYRADGRFMPFAEMQWDEETREVINGTLLFISALCRYVPVAQRANLLRDIITFSPYLDWRKALENSIDAQSAPSEVNGTLSATADSAEIIDTPPMATSAPKASTRPQSIDGKIQEIARRSGMQVSVTSHS